MARARGAPPGRRGDSPRGVRPSRHLLVDGTLQRYRKALGLKGEPRVKTVQMPDIKSEGVVFAQSAGALRSGVTVAALRIHNRALSAEEIRGAYEAGKDRNFERQVTLSNWLSAGCTHVAGTTVTRREVILFVANKLGGVHLDVRRDAKKHLGYGALDGARSELRGDRSRLGLRRVDRNRPAAQRVR